MQHVLRFCDSFRKFLTTMNRETENKIEWFVAVISDFARRFKIKMQPAYTYLKNYGGIDYLNRHYEVLHTFSIDEAIDNTIIICKRHGGGMGV